jgi:hypothetical protein
MRLAEKLDWKGLNPYHLLFCNGLTVSLDATKIRAVSFHSQVRSIYITKQLSHSTSDKLT